MHRSSLQYELQTCLDALPESQPNVLEGYELPSLRIAVCSESFPRCFVLLRPVHSEDPLRPPESTCCFFGLLFPSPTCFVQSERRTRSLLWLARDSLKKQAISISIRCQSTNSSPPIRSLPSAVLPHVPRLRVPVPS